MLKKSLPNDFCKTVLRNIYLVIFSLSFLLTYSIHATDNLRLSGKIMCELSATFIIFDFDNNIAIRNNYDSSKYKLSNYETKENKFKKTVHTFSWYDVKNNFIGYWVISDDLNNAKEIKFDKNGEIFSVNRICNKFNSNNIGELVWE